MHDGQTENQLNMPLKTRRNVTLKGTLKTRRDFAFASFFKRILFLTVVLFMEAR